MLLFPLILVAVAVFSSAIYKHCYSRNLTSDARRTLVKSHAFATEVLQLMILGAGIVVGWGSFASETIMLDIYTISSLGFPVPTWFVATMTVASYCIALLAVDMVDNRIQLGSWQHPIQTQTLLLTRASLAAWSVKKGRGRGRVPKRFPRKPAEKQALKDNNMRPEVSTTAYQQRKRTASEPVTPEMLRRFLREIPVEVSRSGTLIREARAKARRSSSAAAAANLTPTRVVGKSIEGAALPMTPESMFANKKYDVQSKVEVIERAMRR